MVSVAPGVEMPGNQQIKKKKREGTDRKTRKRWRDWRNRIQQRVKNKAVGKANPVPGERVTHLLTRSKLGEGWQLQEQTVEKPAVLTPREALCYKL